MFFGLYKKRSQRLLLEQEFHSPQYLRHTARRLEHLASLRIPVFGKTVIDVGAGIGDHVSYYVDRGCKVTAVDARPENVAFLQENYPTVSSYVWNVEHEPFHSGKMYEVVHCYGLLYHVSDPHVVVQRLASMCSGTLVLETCVSFGSDSFVETVSENKDNPSQAYDGVGSRPTRRWVFDRLKEQFPYVYVPETQPNHEEFPVDWTKPASALFTRAIFVASRVVIDNKVLVTSLPAVQRRHE